ncbi:hypothetical protein [Yoonia sp. I 8.24]|uniref:hypothetical protein n=1 Tax=Yoonia sp. I 8.24 TaxID=1537229 RepID=UPI001EDD520E|nr:hypothetical protein [Yoonia sp. I 8.24]MCG3267729.1 hypothetical protein [Yoonia sp. I 8.24]
MMRPIQRSVARVLAVCGLIFAKSATADTPPDPCHLFQTETEFVTQTLYMRLEDVRHQLTVPEVYFEDVFDRVDGSEHRAQLFRMMVADFTPVSRQDTADLLREGRKEYFNFVLSDYVSMDEALPIIASLMRTGDGRDMSAYYEIEADFNLATLLPRSGAQVRNDVFVARDQNGQPASIISCSNNPAFLNHSCYQNFRASGIDVRMWYPREYLNEWQNLQTSVSDFIACAHQGP